MKRKKELTARQKTALANHKKKRNSYCTAHEDNERRNVKW